MFPPIKEGKNAVFQIWVGEAKANASFQIRAWQGVFKQRQADGKQKKILFHSSNVEMKCFD